MDTGPPPPPLFFFTDNTIPQPYNNAIPTPNAVVSNHHNHSPSSSSPPATSLIIVMIIISSAVIASATIYLLIRFFSNRHNPRVSSSSSSPNDVVSGNDNNHVISITNNINDSISFSLPLFTFSSLTGKINGGDCAVCLSKFDGDDQLRLLPLCCHAFHAQCIDSWLNSNMTCPLCRSTVNPTEADILNKIAGDRTNSFRIEIGTVSQRRDPAESDRRSYSVGSFDYVIDDGYEIPIESTRNDVVDKDTVTPPAPEQDLTADNGGGESGRRNWLRDYVDRVSVSLSSRSLSFQGSGRFFTGSSRRSEAVDDYEATHGRIGEEISELFRWLSGV